MNTPTQHPSQTSTKGRLPALLAAAAALMLGAASLRANHLPTVLPPYPHVHRVLSAAWWQWALSQPVAGHPFNDDPAFDVTAGQRGPVWFLATPFGTVERNVTIPYSKWLFLGLLNAEASDLEGLGATKEEQRDTANFLADHIRDVACEIDGVSVPNMDAYRFTSAQFRFHAPSPWIFGETGGQGTAVADGYYLMVTPLSRGTHTIRITGNFHFAIAEGDPFDFDAVADMTYHITVQ
jgi:hypothetical protein